MGTGKFLATRSFSSSFSFSENFEKENEAEIENDSGRGNLVDRLPAIPLHGVAHGRLELIQLPAGDPADVVMFLGREGKRTGPGPREVDHADVLVRVADTMDVEEARRDQGTRARLSRGRPFTDEFDIEPASAKFIFER